MSQIPGISVTEIKLPVGLGALLISEMAFLSALRSKSSSLRPRPKYSIAHMLITMSIYKTVALTSWEMNMNSRVAVKQFVKKRCETDAMILAVFWRSLLFEKQR